MTIASSPVRFYDRSPPPAPCSLACSSCSHVHFPGSPPCFLHLGALSPPLCACSDSYKPGNILDKYDDIAGDGAERKAFYFDESGFAQKNAEAASGRSVTADDVAQRLRAAESISLKAVSMLPRSVLCFSLSLSLISLECQGLKDCMAHIDCRLSRPSISPHSPLPSEQHQQSDFAPAEEVVRFKKTARSAVCSSELLLTTNP